MAVADAAGLPVAACLASASPHEVKLAEAVLDSLFIAGKPEKLIGDKAYDSDTLEFLGFFAACMLSYFASFFLG